MSTINDYFVQAQLSMSAYAQNLEPGMSDSFHGDAYRSSLVDSGMSISQATEFVKNYTVIDQYTDPETGFSGTVFEKETRETRDSGNPGQNYFLFGASFRIFDKRRKE